MRTIQDRSEQARSEILALALRTLITPLAFVTLLASLRYYERYRESEPDVESTAWTESVQALQPKDAHALADWIKSHVPKEE